MMLRARQVLAALWVAGALATLAAPDATAQITERQRQDALQMLTDARQLFNDAQLDNAIAAFGRVIAATRGATNDLEMRLLLARAYAYRAQAHLVLGQEAQARRDLTDLVGVDATFELDGQEAPAALRTMHRDLLTQTTGTIVFDLPATAAASVNGLVLPAGTRTHRIVQGTHRVLLTEPGRAPATMEVTVRPSGTHTVSLPPLAAANQPTVTAPRGAQAPAPPRRQRGFVHSSLPVVLYTTSYSSAGSFTQSIYNRTASFSVTQSSQIGLGAFELGGGYAVTRGGGFAIGLTYSKSNRDYEGTLSGSVPPPTGFTLRPVSGVDVPTRDVERAYHVEFRGQIGQRHQTVLFAGPSFITLDRDLVRQVTVTETGGGSVAVAPVHLTQRERQIGLNMGIDVGWYPVRYVGIGIGTRYIISRFNGRQGSASSAPPPSFHGVLVTAGLRSRF